ncbi:hypothetical protein K1719_004790 [Acacia pycnantha]|nr:hypothetical protein K1719_004790 [Acacia pycnantha]
MEDVQAFRKHMATLRWGGRGGRLKDTTNDPSAYDECAEAAKWKREVEAKESRKNKWAAKKNQQTPVIGKRKNPSDDDAHSVSDSSPKKKRKAEDDRKRKGKMVDVSSSGEDKDWEATNTEAGSDSTNDEDEENEHVDQMRSKLYKKMKQQQKASVIPESKFDFNQSKLEESDMRMHIPVVRKQSSNRSSSNGKHGRKSQQKGASPAPGPCSRDPSFEEGVAEVGAMFAKIVDEKLGLLKADLHSTLNEMESHLRAMDFDLKDVRDFIYIYAIEFKTFAASRATKHDMGGPSTKPTDEPHSTSEDKEGVARGTSSVHGSPLKNNSESIDEYDDESSKSKDKSPTIDDHDHEARGDSSTEEDEKEGDGDTDSKADDDSNTKEEGDDEGDGDNDDEADDDSRTEEGGEEEGDGDDDDEAEDDDEGEEDRRTVEEGEEEGDGDSDDEAEDDDEGEEDRRIAEEGEEEGDGDSDDEAEDDDEGKEDRRTTEEGKEEGDGVSDDEAENDSRSQEEGDQEGDGVSDDEGGDDSRSQENGEEEGDGNNDSDPGDDGNTGKQGQKEGDGGHDSEHEGGDESMTEEGEKEGDGDQDDDHEGRDDNSRNEEAAKGGDIDEVKGDHVFGGTPPDAQVGEVTAQQSGSVGFVHFVLNFQQCRFHEDIEQRPSSPLQERKHLKKVRVPEDPRPNWFATAKRAAELKFYLEDPLNFDTLAVVFNRSSRFARLQSIHCSMAGRNLYMRFSCSTGDAMGMNMVSKGVQNVLDFLQNDFPDMDVIGISGVLGKRRCSGLRSLFVALVPCRSSFTSGLLLLLIYQNHLRYWAYLITLQAYSTVITPQMQVTIWERVFEYFRCQILYCVVEKMMTGCFQFPEEASEFGNIATVLSNCDGAACICFR